MSVRLKDRNRPIPNGLVFYDPRTKFRAPRYASFTTIVNAVVVNRKANPAACKQHKLSTDFDAVANEVDVFNARICEANGWTDYIIGLGGAGGFPKFKAPSSQEREQVNAVAGRVRKIWSGVRTLNEWLDSGTPPVPKEQAEARAAVCAVCPKNGKGDFTSWFTNPASEVIRKQLARLEQRQIATSLDDKINVCEVCLCPLKLKVQTPYQFIKSNMAPALFDDLRRVPGCWVIEEAKK